MVAISIVGSSQEGVHRIDGLNYRQDILLLNLNQKAGAVNKNNKIEDDSDGKH